MAFRPFKLQNSEGLLFLPALGESWMDQSVVKTAGQIQMWSKLPENWISRGTTGWAGRGGCGETLSAAQTLFHHRQALFWCIRYNKVLCSASSNFPSLKVESSMTSAVGRESRDGNFPGIPGFLAFPFPGNSGPGSREKEPHEIANIHPHIEP